MPKESNLDAEAREQTCPDGDEPVPRQDSERELEDLAANDDPPYDELLYRELGWGD